MDTSVNIRPCALSECVDVLRVWHEAGVTSGVTDSVEALARLVWSTAICSWWPRRAARSLGRSSAAGMAGAGASTGWRCCLPIAGGAWPWRWSRQSRSGWAAGERAGLSLMVEREREGAIAFWGSLKERGYTPDPHILRYFKNL